MARVNIMMAEHILEEVDQAAEEEHLSRSGFLQKAAHQYLGMRRMEQEAREQKSRMKRAAANMDRLANKFGQWDGVGTIRRFRDQRIGAKR